MPLYESTDDSIMTLVLLRIWRLSKNSFAFIILLWWYLLSYYCNNHVLFYQYFIHTSSSI